MLALPLNWDDGGEKLTGLNCPNCSGAIQMRVEGRRRSAFFECRIGHTYALVDFLAAKEETVESSLWRAIYALEELADLLDDLDRVSPDDPRPQDRRDRAASARRHAATIRTVLEEEQPLSLHTDDMTPKEQPRGTR